MGKIRPGVDARLGHPSGSTGVRSGGVAIIPVEVGPKTSTDLVATATKSRSSSAGTFGDGPATLCSLPATRREFIEAGVTGSAPDTKNLGRLNKEVKNVNRHRT